jgi:hypothetical protein
MNGFGFVEYKDAMDARDVVPGESLVSCTHPLTPSLSPLTRPLGSLPYVHAPASAPCTPVRLLTSRQTVPTSWANASSSSSLAAPLVPASTVTPSSALLPVRVALSTACPSPAFLSKPAGRLAISLRCTLSFSRPFLLFLVFCLASSPVSRPDFGSSFFLLWTFSLNPNLDLDSHWPL